MSETLVSQPTQPPDSTERHHAVFFREGDAGLYWSLEEGGVTLSDTGLTWKTEVGLQYCAYSRITSIRLQNAYIGKDGLVGICVIRFGKWGFFTVYGGNSHGGIDDAQAGLYIDFVRDLHKRLSPADKKRIVFYAGLTETRHLIVTVAMIAGAVLFVLLPLALLMIAPSWHVLGIVATGGGLAYGGWRAWEKNRPRHYSPDRLTDELFP